MPASVARLLAASDGDRDAAWSGFVAEFSRLFLHVARAVSRDREETLDCYAHILQELRADQCRRLRTYSTDPRSKFTTWLVVVTRRICVDRHRARYGRRGAGVPGEDLNRVQRRRLEDLAGGTADPAVLPAGPESAPDASVNDEDLQRALLKVVRRLTAADQRLLKLRFFDGLSAAQISQELGFVSLFSVHRRLNKVLGTLRVKLAAVGIDGPLP